MPTDHCQLTDHWRKQHLPQAFHQKAEKVKRKGRCQKSSPPSRTPQLNCKRSLGVPSWQWWQWQLQNINIAVYKYLYVHIYGVSATFTRICMYLALPTINNMLRPLWWFKSDTKEALNSMQTASGNPDLFATSVTALDADTDCIPEQSSYAYVQRLTVTEAHAHATLSRARMPTGHLCPLTANRSLPTYWPLEEAASCTSFWPRSRASKKKR